MRLGYVFRRIYRILYPPDPVAEARKAGCRIGTNFTMLHECILDPSHAWLIEIGDDVTLAPRVHILAHDASTKKHLGYTRIGTVKIGNRVFLGAGVLILPGVTIGDDVVIGAGAIVSSSIANNSVAVGNPARVICSLSDFLTKRKAEMAGHPQFGIEYTVFRGVEPERKREMAKQLTHAGGIGYVV